MCMCVWRGCRDVFIDQGLTRQVKSIRGLKAAITNPNVSEKAKERDRKKLRELGEWAD